MATLAGVIPLAHAGHWAVDLLYLVPVVGFLAWLGRVKYRERREEREASARNSPDVR